MSGIAFDRRLKRLEEKHNAARGVLVVQLPGQCTDDEEEALIVEAEKREGRSRDTFELCVILFREWRDPGNERQETDHPGRP